MAADQKKPLTSRARLYAILARDSSQAIVFRRGPSKQVLLLRWDTATDEIEEGQWLKGRIYERRGDISPDGRLLIYFAASQKPPYRTWTAISRPPWLTALALWPKGDAWGGGGHFASNREVLLNHRPNQMSFADDYATPKWLTTRTGPFAGRGEDNPIWFARMERDGWIQTSDEPVVWEKMRRGCTLQMRIAGVAVRGGPWYVCEHAVIDSSGRKYDIGRSDWADWDHADDLVFAADGCLFRAHHDFDNPTLIADLNGLSFVNRPAPADFTRWPA